MSIKTTSLLLVAVSALSCQKTEHAQDRAATPAPPAPGVIAAPAVPVHTPAELATVVASVDGVVITLAELEDKINQMSPYIRSRYAVREQQQELVESLVRFEVLSKEGYRRGLDQDPEVVRATKGAVIAKLIRNEFDAKLTPESLTDTELHAYYDAHAAEFSKPDEVRLSAIIVKDEAIATRAAHDAAGDAGKTVPGFRDLVTKYSTDADSVKRGGDLRYFSKQTKDVPAPVVAAAFALADGAVSPVIDSGTGAFYVVKQTGKRQGVTRTFAEAEPSVRNRVYRDKRMHAQEAFVAGLRAQSKVVLNPAALDKLKIDHSNPIDDSLGTLQPPPLPTDTIDSYGPGATAPGARL